ncbi:Fc.00g035610.m01.CDS01 [Cosmosporella sp. VM-42]
MGLFGMAVSYIGFSVLHLFCFALALTTCGLYGVDLQRAHEHDKYADGKWTYAVVVGAISAVTCMLYFIPFVLRVAGVFAAGWDLILFILWITLFGIFGKLFISEDPEGDGNIKRMKHAVWVDLVSALLWLIAALASFGYWWKHRDTRSRFTGRARV